jgi:hypothetical protein
VVSRAGLRLLALGSLCHGVRSQPSSSSRCHDWGAAAEAGCAPASQMLVSGSQPAMTDAVSLATSIARPALSRYALTGRWIASHSRATRAQSGMTQAPSRPVVRNQLWRREAVRVSGNSRQSWAQSSAEAICRTCPWQRTGTTTAWSQSCASSTRPRPAGIRPTVFGAFTGTDHYSPLQLACGSRGRSRSARASAVRVSSDQAVSEMGVCGMVSPSDGCHWTSH